MQFNIKDRKGQIIGVADVQTGANALMSGSFAPTPLFAPYAPLFRALEQAATEATTETSDRLQRDIDGHGFRAEGPLPLPTSAPLEALAITRHGVSFRLKPPAAAKVGA
ncbi:hypothetical protein [Achromobacter marplatensis]|jgi:hypothetical protein|uniref:hypothetical protein n=1 Tax=Achromobacter marplatensis TaxID=470868 RepID=UPI0028ED49DD|nr:hypothetical protein [Achromobacter marplatensis]